MNTEKQDRSTEGDGNVRDVTRCFIIQFKEDEYMAIISFLLIIVGIAMWKSSYDGKHRALQCNNWDRFDSEVKGMHKGQIILAVGIILMIISASILK